MFKGIVLETHGDPFFLHQPENDAEEVIWKLIQKDAVDG